MTQSDGLSQRLTKLYDGGRHLNDDSIGSESTLTDAIQSIIEYANTKFGVYGYKVIKETRISLYECQEYFHRVGGPVPDPVNKSVYMKPDGGILMLIKDDIRIPLLITEDKVQGSNDTRLAENKERQSTGNAIERGIKNIRGAEMLFANSSAFPYALFASGCDMHSSETISKRIEMGNMGFPNHYLGISPNTTDSQVQQCIDEDILPKINISKYQGRYSIASVFVKAHKWDEMPHGTSLWKKHEIVKICNKIIDQAHEHLLPK
jgi:hypothetical protein